MRLLPLLLLFLLSAVSPCGASSLKGIASSFSYEARTGLVRLEGDVLVEAKGLRVSSDAATFDERSGRLYLSRDVLVSSDLGEARADSASYDPSADLLVLEGEVVVSMDSSILRARAVALGGSGEVRASGDVRLELKGEGLGVVARAAFLSASGDRVEMRDGVELEEASRGLRARSPSAQLWLGAGDGRRRTVERALMADGVSVEGRGVSATAERADYDVRRELLRLEGSVAISSARGTLRAKVASLDLRSGVFRGVGGRASIGLE